MRLLEINLTNFRCFESLEIAFPTSTNICVFVGDNGAGKSAILDAIALGLAPVARRFNQTPGDRSRRALDITEPPWYADRSDRAILMSLSEPYYRLLLQAYMEGQGIQWDVHLLRDKSLRTKRQVPRMIGTRELYEALDADVHQVAEQTGGTVPVFAYYGTNRAVIDIPQRQRDFQTKFSRETAINRALDPVSRFKDAFMWFFAMERDELVLKDEKKDFSFRLPVLEAVRRALHAMLPEFADPRITTQPLHFLLSRKNSDGSTIDLFAEQLSDGYRTMLALVMDFARRLAQANPQLPDPLATEAILMIDEVDLHLHPLWQQRIVPDLARTFPNTQIILTTHSQEVLTTVSPEAIFIIRNGKIHPCTMPTYGAKSPDVAVEVMGVKSQRPPGNEITSAISKLFDAIDAGDLAAARTQRQSLANWAKGYPEPDLVRADLLIRRLEARKDESARKTT